MLAVSDEIVFKFLPVGLDSEEKERCKSFAVNTSTKCLRTAIIHPITLSKVLWQFGYEPFPVTAGRSFWVAGSYGNYLPNLLQYLRGAYYTLGLKSLYKGVDANIVSMLFGGISHFATSMYLDHFYPEVGGDLNSISASADGDHKEIRRAIRRIIRDSICATIGTIISRPFITIMTREIAQIVGNESKYSNVIQALYMIGREEGPAGLYSGLIPQLLFEWTLICGTTVLSYGFNSMANILFDKEETDEMLKDAEDKAKLLIEHSIPMIANTLSYPFQLISTVMSVVGSGLIVSMLPYSPIYETWHDAYDTLKSQKALTRGQKIFWRGYRGPVKIDRNTGNVYANTSFI